MSATVIRLDPYDRPIRPLPDEPATVIALNERRAFSLKDIPLRDLKRAPRPSRRRTRRQLEDDDRQAEPIGPGEKEAAAPVKT